MISSAGESFALQASTPFRIPVERLCKPAREITNPELSDTYTVPSLD